MKKIEIDNETNELNWLFGGYFSGVGNIYIYKQKEDYKIKKGKNKRTRYRLRTSIHFDDKKIAELFKENFGGAIRNKNDNKNRIVKGKEIPRKRNWWWYCVGSNAGCFIGAIQPYILEKRMKKQIKIGLKFHNYQLKHLFSQSETVRKQKHKYYLQMRRLR